MGLRQADAEAAELVERLADPSVYADGERVRGLIARHNAARERSSSLGSELERIAGELDAAERIEAPAGRGR